MRSPTGNKAKGIGEVDQVLQRDKSVVSQLLKATVQEKNNTKCCMPNKKPKPSSRKPFWSKMHPARSIRREEGKDKRCPHPHGAAEEQGLSRLSQRDHSGLILGHVGTSSGSFCEC